MTQLPARSLASVLATALFLAPISLAFDTPLSDQAVREAYFLGQRRDESFALFLDKYTQRFAPPKTGPHIYSVTFLTPYALLVQESSRRVNYSAQQAAKDHRGDNEIVSISIEILLTESYGAMISTPTNSRSGSPIGYQLRSSSFWKAVRLRVFDGDQELTVENLAGEPIYRSEGDGGSNLIGATIHLQFPATSFTSDSATIEVIPPAGGPVAVDFDLASLR